MNKIQKFAKTIGDAVNVTDPTTSAGKNATDLNTALANIGAGALTDAQREWLNKKINADAQSDAESNFVVSDNLVPSSVNTDDATSYSGKRTVTFTYKGSLVDVTGMPDAYTRQTTGVYTCDATNTQAAPGANISYTNSDGIKITKTISSRLVTVNNVAYYGWYASKDIPSDVKTVAANLTAIYGGVSGVRPTNNIGADAYIWVITKGTAKCKQMGLTGGFSLVKSGVSFISPKNASINLEDYKIYISDEAKESGYNNAELEITNK